MASKRGRPKKKSLSATEITRKKAAATKPQNSAPKANAPSGKREIVAILLFALALLTLVAVIIKGENLWLWLHNTLFGLFGVAVFALPVILGAIAVFLAMDKLRGSTTVKIVECSLLFVFVDTLVDIFTSGDITSYGNSIVTAFNKGVELKSGGAVGAIFGALLEKCGTAPSAAIVIIVIFVLLMLITGTTLMGFFRAVSKPVRARRVKEEKEEESKSEPQNERKFNINVSVDDIPESRENIFLEDKGQKLIDSYNFDDEGETEEAPKQRKTVKKLFGGKEKGEQLSLAGDATDISADENAISTEVIDDEEKVNVKEETNAFAKEVMEGAEYEEVYEFPDVSLLNENKNKFGGTSEKELRATAENLVNVLKSFGVETRVVDVSRGPAVTRYELQPSVGVKISKITGLADDIALNLATAGVRIEAPIPNKAAVGIEVPNKATSMVGIKEILETNSFKAAKSKLTVALGKDIGGNAVMTDIAKMPHGLIAGSTGSGKSVCINSIIMSLLYKASPDDVRLLMIDPKVVELGVYNGIPHLLVPVVTDPRKASGALGWAVTEMEKRYRLFAENDVRNLEGYNHLAEMSDDLQKMYHIVIIIDELADLMMTAPKEVEDAICRIAQKARAAGMHLIIATQRPSVDVVTGLIKANVPTRIAFAVSSQIDSRTILDMGGAEKLLGKGDMLFCPVGSNKPTRIQGCFVSDAEVERVVNFVKNGKTADYDKEISDTIENLAVAGKDKGHKNDSDAASENDPMIDKAIECVIEAGQASTSLLQRRLKLGYARAARIVDEMEALGVVGPYEGSKPRQVLISQAEWLERQALAPADGGVPEEI